VQPQELPLEFMMNHARLKHGFSLKTYESVTGLKPDTLKTTLSTLIKEGWLVEKNAHYHCTEQGWNFLDCLLEKFIP
jgi:coproporphyrinogen III oxidase-like Fe-S oxidoreductase